MPTEHTLASLLAHGAPVSGFSVRVPPTPCDVCTPDARRRGRPVRMADVDAKMRGRSSWAYMCTRCWVTHGYSGSLGTGRGQVLLPLAPEASGLDAQMLLLTQEACEDEAADAPMSDARKAWLES